MLIPESGRSRLTAYPWMQMLWPTTGKECMRQPNLMSSWWIRLGSWLQPTLQEVYKSCRCLPLKDGKQAIGEDQSENVCIPSMSSLVMHSKALATLPFFYQRIPFPGMTAIFSQHRKWGQSCPREAETRHSKPHFTHFLGELDNGV